VFNWGGRKAALSDPPDPVPSQSETRSTTKVLPRVLAALSQRQAPVLMDLGPVIGANVSFFGEHLACRILVEDMFADVERTARTGARETLAELLPARLDREPGSLDGVLCWDLFDYLERPTALALAARLVELIRPGGVLYGFFGQKPGEISSHTRFVVESPEAICLRSQPATPVPRTVIVNRDLNRMFDGLVVSESVLLKTGSRETLFRKPS